MNTSRWPTSPARMLGAAVALFVLWTLFALLSSAHFFFGYEGATDLDSFLALADNVIVFYWGWALLTPLVLWIARRVARSGMPRMREAMILIAAGIGVMLLHGVVHTTLVSLFGLAHKEPAGIAQLASYAMRHGGGDLATFGVLVGVYLLFEANRRARARELAAAELATRLASADLELLRWHLHPHFLFNALNTVSTLVLKGETEQASAAITMISRYLRAGIAQRADSLVPLGDDIEMVRQYVDIETLRFGDSLRVEIDADSAALDSRIPGSLLQPIVENAITHGSVREPGSDPIRITATTDNARLKLTITNPSNGEADAGSVSDNGMPDTGRFGLRYVRERLRQFYGDRATFDLSRSRNVTVASFDLPIE